MKTKKILALALAAVLLMAMTVAGTVAYLQASTQQVVNEFTPSNINVKLEETPNTDDGKWTAQLIPGVEYTKDPKVTVAANANNVASYLFVKVTGADKAATYLDDITYVHEVEGNKWKVLDAAKYPGVYYLELTAAEAQAGLTVDLINGNKVKVQSGLNADVLATANFALSFQAWIIQQAGFENDIAKAYITAGGN